MSLIHEALKKVQDKEKASLGSGLASFQPSPEEEKPRFPKRAVILGAVLLLLAVYFAYTKFVSKRETNAPQKSAESATSQPSAAGQDVSLLKKNAFEAYHLEDFDAAWASLSAASRLDQNDPEIWNNLGLVARKRGDMSQAREAYQKALELKPEYPEALNNLAVLEMQAGNNTGARELLEKAINISPAYPEANLHLALLCDQKGEKQKAIEYYKRFLGNGRSYPVSITDSVRSRVMEIEE